jgi:predicted NAD-dependent protein-ADP-ribosyltransferase YbiA (DUF1768 family)
MNSSVNILNPTDKPFGRLSNNYKMLMELDDKKWNSVSNYIYSNSMPVPLYSNLLHNIDPKDASKEFNKFIDKMIETTAFTALQNGILERLNKDAKFRDALFAIGNAPIVYDSDNKLFGIKNNGSNMAGKVMEQLRNQYIIKHGEEKIIQSEQELIVKIQRNYIAYMLLKSLIRENKSSLDEFFGVEPSAIIEKINPKQLREPNPPLEIIFNMYKSKQIPDAVMSSIANFDIAIHQLRKEYMRKTDDEYRDRTTNIIFNTYLMEMLKREYPNFSEQQIEDAHSTIYLTTDQQKLNEKRELIADLFTRNIFEPVFSENMTNIINKNIEAYNIVMPNKEEMLRIESYVMPSFNYQLPQEITTIVTDDKLEPVKITPSQDNPLCIEHNNSVINMDGRIYPSVAHYVYAMLLSQLSSVKNISNAHKLFVINKNKSERDLTNYISSQEAKKIFFDTFFVSVVSDIKKYAKIAIDKKFQNKLIQDILLTTGNSKIIWNDPNDVILGMVKGNGENFVGEYMMKIRNDIKQSTEKDLKREIAWSKVIEIIETDSFINEWIKLRVKELIMNAHIMASCCKSTISSDFIKIIIEELYDKCSIISSHLDVMPDIVPRYFMDIVKSFSIEKKVENDGEEKRVYKKVMINVKEDVAKTIWQYILVLILTVYDSAKEHSVYAMREIIAESEIYLSKKRKCEGEIPNNFNKCIFSALINVLSKIEKISRSVLYPFKINHESIDIAVNIILNKNLQRELNDNNKEENIYETLRTEHTEKPNQKLMIRRKMKVAPLNSIAPPVGGEDSDEEMDELVFENSDDESGSEKSTDEGIFEDKDEEDEDDEEDEEDRDEGDDLIQDRTDESIDLSSTVIDYHIINELKVIDSNIEDDEDVIKHIKNAIKEIAKYKIPFKIKINRINFFATLI